MSLRRGFKAEANRIAVRLRDTLGLGCEDPIDFERVAKHLNFDIVPLSAFAAKHAAEVRQLTVIDPGAFSAATLLRADRRRIILHNDGHDRGRQRSNIAHEVAHILLNHRSTFPIDSTGCRQIDFAVEEEANWLGSVILIPDQAALRIVYASMDTVTACDTYGVSAPLLRMRINASGARIRVARSYQ